MTYNGSGSLKDMNVDLLDMTSIYRVKDALPEITEEITKEIGHEVKFFVPLVRAQPYGSGVSALLEWEEDASALAKLGLPFTGEGHMDGRRVLQNMIVSALAEQGYGDSAAHLNVKMAADFAAHLLGIEHWEDNGEIWISDEDGGDDKMVSIAPFEAEDGTKISVKIPNQQIKITNPSGNTVNNIWIE